MAAEQEESGGLQVEDDRRWQEALWIWQRVGWALMALLVVAALLGALGLGGPLSTASAEASGAKIDYPRIARWEADHEIVVTLPPTTSGDVEVELSRAFAELFSVKSVEPEPSQVTATGSGHLYSFDVAAGGGEKIITFTVRPEEPALLRTVEARVADSPPARLPITVLP